MSGRVPSGLSCMVKRRCEAVHSRLSISAGSFSCEPRPVVGEEEIARRGPLHPAVEIDPQQGGIARRGVEKALPRRIRLGVGGLGALPAEGRFEILPGLAEVAAAGQALDPVGGGVQPHRIVNDGAGLQDVIPLHVQVTADERARQEGLVEVVDDRIGRIDDRPVSQSTVPVFLGPRQDVIEAQVQRLRD